MNTEKVIEYLNFDALNEAEKISGKSYKEDESTSMLGMLMHLSHAKKTKRLLESINDTLFSEKVDSYIQKVSVMGFSIVFKEEFRSEKRTEAMYILFNKQFGIIISFDTHRDNINSGHIYYNWQPNNLKDSFNHISSGGFVWGEDGILLINDKGVSAKVEGLLSEPKFPEKREDYDLYQKEISRVRELNGSIKQSYIYKGFKPVYSGYHDCREGALSKIQNLLNNGSFIPKWIDCPINWLLNYTEYRKDENHNSFSKRAIEITHKRISKLSKEVIDCINYKI